jgi:hypothetical protein
MQRSLAAFLTLLLAGAAATTGIAAPAKRKAPVRAKRAARPPVTAAPATAPDPEASRILDAYEAARPADEELGLFRLDWAGSLKEAKARAVKEGRPIFFVSTTQLERAGDLRGGHC